MDIKQRVRNTSNLPQNLRRKKPKEWHSNQKSIRISISRGDRGLHNFNNNNQWSIEQASQPQPQQQGNFIRMGDVYFQLVKEYIEDEPPTEDERDIIDQLLSSLP